VSSVEGYESCDEVDSAKEGACEFVVAGCDSSELFEIVEETLDQIAFAVKHKVGLALFDAICLGWDHRRYLSCVEMVDESIGVISLVGQEDLWPNFFQKRLCLPQVGSLSSRERNRDRIAQSISDHMDFGGQSPSGSADGLIPPFCAPALCWCARTMVESSIMYSLSWSAAKCLNMRSKTPLSHQRRMRR
jgi:hypothetical protein